MPKEYLDGTSAAYGGTVGTSESITVFPSGLAPEYVLGARLSHEEADAQLAASLGLELKNEKRGGTVANMTLNDVEEIAAVSDELDTVGYGIDRDKCNLDCGIPIAVRWIRWICDVTESDGLGSEQTKSMGNTHSNHTWRGSVGVSILGC